LVGPGAWRGTVFRPEPQEGQYTVGRYWCGTPEAIPANDKDSKSYGPWFIPLQPEDGVTVDWTAIWRAEALKYVSPKPTKKPKDVAKRGSAKP
jgi:hypothetical protein